MPASFDIAQLVDDLDALPPLPEVAQAILRFGDGGKADLRGLCTLIQQDVALTARVLRVANSPFYGLQGSVNTLDDAMVVLGSATLRAIALTGALIGPFDTARSLHFDAHRFWRHALASGVLAQRLAQVTSVAPASAFTAGLLHQIGVLALCALDPPAFDRIEERAARETCSFSQACQHEFARDPGVLGAKLMCKWSLPESLCSAVWEWRHPPAGTTGAGELELADVIHLANRLAHLLVTMPFDPWPNDLPERLHAVLLRHPLEPAVLERQRLDPMRVLQLLRPAACELERLEALLN